MKLATQMVVVMAPLALCLVGCGKSKIAQCNSFIDRANQSQTSINALTFDSDDPNVLEKGAVTVEKEAVALAAVDLKDDKLVGFRNEYGTTLTQMAKILRDLATAQKDAKDPSKAKTVEAQAKTFGAEAEKLEKTESALVDQINVYCTGAK